MIIAGWVVFGIVILLGLGYLGLRSLGRRAATVRADEVHMVLTKDVWRIRLCRYRPRREGNAQPEPILFCHGFMSNQFNFTLPREESMVDYFCEQGYDCWTIDLRGNLSSVAPFGHSYNEPTMDDYLQYDIPATVEHIRKATGSPKVHWVGHSMGGMLLYAREAMNGNEHIASATTLGSPIGFDGMEFHRPTVPFLLRRLMGRYAFRGGMRVLLSVFTTIKPNLKLLPLAWDNMYSPFGPDDFYAAADAPPIRVAEGLARAAQNKTWVVAGDVDVYAGLVNMKTPLFAIFGAADPLVPISTVVGFFETLTTRDKKMLVISKENGFVADYSHLDLVFGKETRSEVFQPILKWIKRHPVSGVVVAEPEAVVAEPVAEPEAVAVDPEPIALEQVVEEAEPPAPKKRAVRKAPAKKTPEVAAAVVEVPVEVKAPAKKAAAKKPATAPVAKKPTVKKAPVKKKPAIKQPVAEKAVATKTLPTKKPVARKKNPATEQ